MAPIRHLASPQLGWLLPLGILLFFAWNLINDHWLIALGSIALIDWPWYRRTTIILFSGSAAIGSNTFRG
ncbi:MAG: hypothetical protein HY785_13605 [Oscillatoriophycideae cyanobacterium NC_groundwater_1537_Pr4_S-0.65um_50_18]|nr:hypothetical protein [Oscillatoriophycideae cyanobacterium NC_groundwater_1537_Pr4_S-0.65um_50_18]